MMLWYLKYVEKIRMVYTDTDSFVFHATSRTDVIVMYTDLKEI